MENRQPTSHPLKWKELVHQVETMSDTDNPDVWIEDVRRYGPCIGVDAELVSETDNTDAIEASFSVLHDKKNNRIIIRHHF